MRNPTTSDAVAAEVRANLARQGRSRQWLCDQIGMAQSGLSRRLNGHRSFTLDELVRIAEVLGVPLASLLPDPVKAAS